MKESMIFPRDPDTLEVMKQIETYLGLSHKNINEISNFKLHEYINQLTCKLQSQDARIFQHDILEENL